MSTQINLWHSDLWRVSFSNIPGMTNADDMYLFENYAKSVSFPEYSMEVDGENFQGFRVPLPQSAHDLNREVALLQVEFKLVENFKNYLYLFNWIQNIRYGQNITTGNVRDYNCKVISIFVLDNMKRLTGKFKFTNCFVTNLTAIPMAYGTGEEVTFQANFNYEEIHWEPEDIPQCES